MEEVYEVKSSDTLSGIALKYKMTVNEIKQLNQLYNNNVFPGQKLKVIKKEDIQEEEKNVTQYAEHKVAPFESLAMIALAFDMKISELKSINSLSSNNVRVGDILKVRAKSNVHKEKKISIPMAPKKVENNAIDITFELIKDFPTPAIPLKSNPNNNKDKKTANKSINTVDIQQSPPEKIPTENILYSENEIVDRIIKESEKSNLNFIVNNSISEDVLKELDKLNTKKLSKKQKKKNQQPKKQIAEEKLDPPTLLSKSTIIRSDENLAKIRTALPRRYQPKRWTLLYGTQEHGISYQTFLRRVRFAEASLVFVEDSRGHVFGGFVSSHWRVEEGYYGSGESFLFRLYPETQIYKWDPSHPESNSYFMLCHNDHFEIGGGGHPGLWIDSEFDSGTSGESNTFQNPILSSTSDFVCTVLEFWGFTL